MSTATASEEVLQHAQSLIACIRDVVREELANDLHQADPVDTDALKSELREDLRRDVLAAGGTAGPDTVQACLDHAETLFASDEWRRQVNLMIQEALKGVLPSMVKRFRSEMEDSLGDQPGNSTGAADPTAVVNSTEMKEMLEDRFRQMLLYLKTDVIPQAVKQGST